MIAADLQEEMLAILRENWGPKASCPGSRPPLSNRILSPSPRSVTGRSMSPLPSLSSTKSRTGKAFREIAAMLVPGGLFFYSEPPIIVSGSEFRESLVLAEKAGLRLVETRLFFVNRAAVLSGKRKGDHPLPFDGATFVYPIIKKEWSIKIRPSGSADQPTLTSYEPVFHLYGSAGLVDAFPVFGQELPVRSGFHRGVVFLAADKTFHQAGLLINHFRGVFLCTHEKSFFPERLI